MNTNRNKRLIFQWFKFSKGQFSLGANVSKEMSVDGSMSEFYLHINLIKWSLTIGFRKVKCA